MTYAPGVIVDWVKVLHFPLLSPQDCVDGYIRRFPEVVCTSGPTITERQMADCGTELVTVEWVWSAGNPYRFSVPRWLVEAIGGVAPAGVTLGTRAVLGSGVEVQYDGVIASTPWDCDAPVVPTSCAADPGNPGTVPPPQPVLIPDPNRSVIDDDWVTSVQVFVPRNQIGQQDGVFSFRLDNDAKPKVGIRVRVYDDITASGQPLDVCTFAYEYQIDYLGPGRSLSIDGQTGRNEVDCDDGGESAAIVLHGAFGGPVPVPEASCDRDYLVVVQWLYYYPKTVPGYYVGGEKTGDLHTNIAISEREG
jgi:hypothetical protein